MVLTSLCCYILICNLSVHALKKVNSATITNRTQLPTPRGREKGPNLTRTKQTHEKHTDQLPLPQARWRTENEAINHTNKYLLWFQIDQVKESVFTSSEMENKNSRKAASASFFKILGGGSKHGKTVTKSMLDHYEDNRTHSEIITFGGPVFLYVPFLDYNIIMRRRLEGNDQESK